MVRVPDGAEARERAAEALLEGRSGHVSVAAALGPGQPDPLLAAVLAAARRRDLALTLLIGDVPGGFAFLDASAEAELDSGRLRIVSLAGATPRRLAGRLDYVTSSLWDTDRMLATGELAADVLVARVVATGDPDVVALGDMVGWTPSLLARDLTVGFEVGPGRAFPGEGCLAPRARAAVVVGAAPASPADAAPAARPLGAEQAAIGRRVAALVVDGATVQLGLGAIPRAVVAALRGKPDLGLHSGMLPATIREELDGPTFNGTSKTVEPGLHVATGILDPGPEPASAWGPNVRLAPISVTHSPRTLAGLDRLWSINSAFEIDLAGQVNAEFAAGARVASGGGQSDFMRAAHLSAGGGAVLALPSRARDGTPRIVARLAVPHVTATAADLDYVVTEHGVADLRGASADERAAALIDVAHPDDRGQLRRGLEAAELSPR